ncbi:MAG: lysophospholipid acyltransferase family protein [Pseudomonadota bacterium]
MLWLRSLLFSIGSILALSVVVFVGFFCAPFSYRIRYGWISQWARFNIWWLRVTCKLDYVVEGRENIPQEPVIVFCKHQSTWETLIMQVLLPPQVWVLKRELLWVPVFGWGLALLKPIAIQRGAGRKAVFQIVDQGVQRLRDGQWVVIFPEGTRVAPGERVRYGIGGAVLAERSGGFKVLPVAHNAGEYWGRRQFIKRPGTIKIVFGPLITTEGKTAAEINAEAEAWIEGAAAEISTLRSR